MNTALLMFLLLLLYYNGLLVYSKDDTKCDGIYRKGRVGNGRFATLHSSNITECAKLCFYRQLCGSFSYNSKEKKCILHNHWTTDFENNANYVFSSIKTWNPRIAGSCFNHSCKDWEMCLPGINTYYCLELDRDCGLPLQMNSAVIAWGNKWFVRYKCLVNMIGEDARKSKCQHSSVWSKPEACRYSCKLPYIVSFNMTNSTYSESCWKYECQETNTSCRMKTIWNNGSNHYLDISCTTKNNVSSQLTNFSYFCAKSKIVDNFNYFQPCLPKKARHPCRIRCDVPRITTKVDDPQKNCTRKIICNWMRFPKVQIIKFCAPKIQMENGTISFEGVMKMVCEVFDRFSLEANKRKLAARLLDFQVGVWEQASTEEIERSDTGEESQRSDTEEVSQRSDTEEVTQRSDTEEESQKSDTEEESQKSGITEEELQKSD